MSVIRIQKPRSGPKSGPRFGVAVVELAVCLPVLVILTLATIEACTLLFVQQSLKTTAFEGARVGIVPGAMATNVAFQCETLLDDHSVQSYTVEMDPADPATLKQGDWFTVTVTAAFADNTMAGGWLYIDKTLQKSVSLRAE
ncbi:TadE-like protein [Rubripirellula tenax]|uniref:TadE-like protein n=1 Tax=Rubripirellula tenax TaxID=2528015 RepID=A0A5C6E9J7_9BACT|nr:TadE family protein [Rubripirellula tenax]TWU46363.1 TadE-like protein [Rubripirellula tenax]